MEIRPGGYLFNHLEEPQAENEGETQETLDTPIIEGLSIDYSAERSQCYESGNFRFNVAFTDLPRQEAMERISELQQARLSAVSDPEKKKISKMIKFYSTPAFTINKFKLENDPHTLDLEELEKRFPQIKIIFNPKKEIGFVNNSESGEIWISGDITKIETLLVMLHEIGHITNPNSESAAGRSRFVKEENITEQEAELLLENERKAWAFALNQIRPFIDKNNKAAVINYIHEYSLGWYSDRIREQIAPRWKLILPHILEYFSQLQET